MSIIVDDNKHYLTYKISTDNLRLVQYIRDNRVELVNYVAVLIATNIITRIE